MESKSRGGHCKCLLRSLAVVGGGVDNFGSWSLCHEKEAESQIMGYEPDGQGQATKL
jgi:hypothetical protein